MAGKIKLSQKQKRAIVIISAGGLGLNAVLSAFNFTVLKDLLNTVLFGPISIGVLIGTAGIFSAWMLISKEM